MTDYFALLGLQRSASDAEIKEAYRRLAKQYHPDLIQGDYANPDPDAAKKMQLLNQAKETLFDPAKRKEHKVYLALRDAIARKQLEALMGIYAPDPALRSTASSRNAPVAWSKKEWGRFYFASIAVAALAIIAFFFSDRILPKPPKRSPIEQIVANNTVEPSPFGGQQPDTATVPNLPAAQLKTEALLFDHLGATVLAARYWKKYIEVAADTAEPYAKKMLWQDYFKLGQYVLAVQTVNAYIHSDSALAVTYFELGKLFNHAEKPIDAKNAFEESIIISTGLRKAGHPAPYLESAKKELDQLD